MNSPAINSSGTDKGELAAGHNDHFGPVWFPGITVTWGDIIPPYDYEDFHYAGLNWTAAGQAIYNNGCNIPEPTEAPTNPPTEAPTNPPTEAPTNPPTEAPTNPPTEAPTNPPTEAPTNPPTEAPTEPPTPGEFDFPTIGVEDCTEIGGKAPSS